MRERSAGKNPSLDDETSPFSLGRLFSNPFDTARRNPTISIRRRGERRRSSGINYGSLLTIRSL